MSAKANLPLPQTPPPTWSDARNTMQPVQFTMFRYLLPYPSGPVAAHHNRAGIGPMLVASDRRRSGTGPPWQVHRIRALVWVYCTTIQIYKYKIIQKNIQMKMRQWQPIWHGSPQQIRQATLSSPRRVFISENRKCNPATAASYRAIRAATIATSSDPDGKLNFSCVIQMGILLFVIRGSVLSKICSVTFFSWDKIDECLMPVEFVI